MEIEFSTPAKEFQLTRIKIPKGQNYFHQPNESPGIYISLEGTIQTEAGTFERGAHFFSGANQFLNTYIYTYRERDFGISINLFNLISTST